MDSFRFPSVLLVLGLSLFQPALANIYVYTNGNGSVLLSNVPADERYTLLLGGDEEGAAKGARTDSGKITRTPYDRIVEEAARTYGLETALLHAVITVESAYNPGALSKKGAAGLMQLMPRTARYYGVDDAFDPGQNIAGGAKYLRDLLDVFNNDLSLTLAAYNAGQTTVRKYGNRIPPIRETMDYVPKVMDFYRKYRGEVT